MKSLGQFVYGCGTHLFEGFVFQTVWGWFIVPLGVIILPYWTCVIIVLLIGWLVLQLPFAGWNDILATYEHGNSEGHAASLIRTTVFLAMAGQMLLFAWVIHLITK